MRDHTWFSSPPSGVKIQPVLAPNEVYDILVDTGVVEDEGHWGAMLSERTRPFEGLTLNILGAMRVSVDDDYPNGVEHGDEANFTRKYSDWDDETLYEILREAPDFDHGRWSMAPAPLVMSVKEAAKMIGILAEKRVNSFFGDRKNFDIDEFGDSSKLPESVMEALFSGMHWGKDKPPSHLVARVPPTTSKPKAASKPRTPKREIKIGDRFFTKVSGNVVEVEVFAVRPPDRLKPRSGSLYHVRRADNGKTLTPRSSRELHTTRGPW